MYLSMRVSYLLSFQILVFPVALGRVECFGLRLWSSRAQGRVGFRSLGFKVTFQGVISV